METKKGLVSNLRSSVDVSGGNYGIFVNTAQVTLFSIDDMPVMMVNKKPPVIQNGNTVIVSGEIDNGQLIAYAYQNLSTSSKGNKGYVRRFIAFILLMLLGLSLWFFLAEDLGYGLKIISTIFTAFALYYLYIGNKILNAVKHIDYINLEDKQ